MTDGSIEDRLRLLGVFPDTPQSPNSVRENAQIFQQFATLDEIDRAVALLHLTVSAEQFVFYHLQALLQHPAYKSDFLTRAQEELGGLGIMQPHIADYFQSSNPRLTFNLRYENAYTIANRNAFNAKAGQFALDRLREWMGIPSAKQA